MFLKARVQSFHLVRGVSAALAVALSILFALWLIFQSLGVFVGSFRADELHFIQNAWMDYSGHEATIYTPPLFHHLIQLFWFLADGDLRYLYALRLFNFTLYCLQGVLVWKLLASAFPDAKNRYRFPVFGVVVFSFLSVLASFRGYEVRPEGLGNTLLLLALVWLFGERRTAGLWSLTGFLAVCMSLVVAASLSFRLSLPAVCLWLAVVTQVLLGDEGGRSQKQRHLLLAAGASLLALLMIVFFTFDWEHIFQRLNRQMSDAPPMSLRQRFTVNGWLDYGEHSLLALAVTGLAAAYAQLITRPALPERVVHLLVALALAMFYLFLFVWDVDPRGYIHSIEWVLMLGLFLHSVKIGRFATSVLRILLVVLFAGALFLAQKATNELFFERNTSYFLSAAKAAPDVGEMAALDTPSLVKQFGWMSSLPGQINARRAFCDRYRGSFVISADISFHPICLVDVGTYDFAGWGNKPVDLLSVPADQSLIVLAADDGKLAPLAAHYGERYKVTGNIAIIQKR